jgi:hypothetical protein
MAMVFFFRLVGVAGFEPATTRTPSVKRKNSSMSFGSARYTSRACPPTASVLSPRGRDYYRAMPTFIETPHKSPHSPHSREFRHKRPSRAG